MASVKLKLKTSQILKDGTHPIIIQVLKDSKKAITTLDVSCDLENWSTSLNLPKNRRLSIICQKRLLEMEELLYEGIDNDWSAKKIVNVFSGKELKELYFLEYIENYEKEQIQAYNTFKLKDSFRLRFLTFLNNKDIVFKHVTYELLDKYKKDLISNNISTYIRYLNYLKKVYDYAVDNEDYIPRKYPFKKLLFNKTKMNIETEQKNLTKEQTVSLFSLEGNKSIGDFYNISLDMWRFCFLMRGINFSDMAMMKVKDVESDYFVFVRQKLKSKTRRVQKIKIFKEAREIIDKYKSADREFVFPILENGMDIAKNERDGKHYKYRKNTINENFKRIGKKLELDFSLTTMSPRYTFINLAKDQDISFLYLQEMIGHKTMTTTDVYMDIFKQDKLDEYHRKVIDLVLRN